MGRCDRLTAVGQRSDAQRGLLNHSRRRLDDSGDDHPSATRHRRGTRTREHRQVSQLAGRDHEAVVSGQARAACNPITKLNRLKSSLLPCHLGASRAHVDCECSQ